MWLKVLIAIWLAVATLAFVYGLFAMDNSVSIGSLLKESLCWPLNLIGWILFVIYAKG